uniref:Uncharacterized protein n=1 Tax=Arundo donax TaxID=35708 RepID=A0A0A9G7R8_ARUDO
MVHASCKEHNGTNFSPNTSQPMMEHANVTVQKLGIFFFLKKVPIVRSMLILEQT